jgi:hypothetical protein
MAGYCEYSNEPLDSTKGVEFLDKMSGLQLLKTDSALCS